MKNIYLTLFLSFFLPMVTDAQQTNVIRQTIQSPWEFRQAGKGEWRPTEAPVSIHTALLRHGLIEDPYYRDNEEKVQWIEQEDWEFRATFEVGPTALSRKHVELSFKGIDTHAHIYVNDSLVLETDNMFRTWSVDVKRWLKPGANQLHIYFESPVKKMEGPWQDLGYELPGGIRTMSRKAQFHFGWDWGPRLAGCGILAKPELVAWDNVILENVFFSAQSITPENARIVAHFRYRADQRMTATVIVNEVQGNSMENRTLLPGVLEDSVWFDVPNPRLWWCRDMGEPYLYTFGIALRTGGQLIEQHTVRMGIRTIELVKEPDASGQPFYFKLNGKPVFCRGANYIPQDMLQDRVTPDRYNQMMRDVVASNMNMLRVWGGGIYEEKYFYDLCDQYGILVWQDFMYACALYPSNGRFLKTAAKEAGEQVQRLRQHPSIALWCGNNENSEAWHNWGWQMQFNEGQRAKLWRDYQIMFQELLPNIVESFSDGVPYWESSPKYSRYNPKADKEGDAHFWGVWHDEQPFDAFNKRVPRFMSEFGFQSFPEWRTIEAFTLPEDRQLESKVMLSHQKHPRGNALIAEYMQRDYRMPRKFEDFVYVSQLLQAEGMRTGIEAHRRNKPYCMGTLYWQLNDVWPVASWSGIDCFGRWKALQYYVRESFKPIAALPFAERDTLYIYGVADLPADTTALLSVQVMNFDGKILFEQPAEPVTLETGRSRVVWQQPIKSILAKNKPESAVAEIVLRSPDGTELYRRLHYFAPPRKLALQRPNINVTVGAKGTDLVLRADRLAKNVFISIPGTECRFSDNYIDLLPGRPVTITLQSENSLENLEKTIVLKNLFEIY